MNENVTLKNAAYCKKSVNWYKVKVWFVWWCGRNEKNSNTRLNWQRVPTLVVCVSVWFGFDVESICISWIFGAHASINKYQNGMLCFLFFFSSSSFRTLSALCHSLTFSNYSPYLAFSHSGSLCFCEHISVVSVAWMYHGIYLRWCVVFSLYALVKDNIFWWGIKSYSFSCCFAFHSGMLYVLHVTMCECAILWIWNTVEMREYSTFILHI